jgi:hypothetical protein
MLLYMLIKGGDKDKKPPLLQIRWPKSMIYYAGREFRYRKDHFMILQCFLLKNWLQKRKHLEDLIAESEMAGQETKPAKK